MSAKRSDKMLGELMAVIADYLSASEDDTDLRGRVRCWLDVAEGRVCQSDSAGRLAGGPAPIDRDEVLIGLLKGAPWITSTQLAKACAVCSETARLYLRSLAKRKIVRRVGDKRGARWIAGVNYADFAEDTARRFGKTWALGLALDNSALRQRVSKEPAQASPGYSLPISNVAP